MNTAALYIFFFSGKSNPTPPDTHDGGHYIHRDSHKKRHLALLKRQEDKVREREKLRLMIEIAAYGEPEIKRPELKKAKQIQPVEAKAHDYSRQLRAVELELALLERQARQLEVEQRRMREEDDIKAILLALGAPFDSTNKTIH